MADIAIFRVNYKSDFVITLQSDAGWTTPFCIKFWTDSPSCNYFVGWDGKEFINCKVDAADASRLIVLFDDHNLPVGQLKMQLAWHTTIADFPHARFDEVMNQMDVVTTVEGEEKQVILDLNGETAPEIAFSLPAYANEAQRIANEEQRIADEEARIQNEETRISAEQVRQQNETQRIAREQTRQNNEAQRIEREQARQTNEELRIEREQARQTNEELRIEREQARQSNEEQRIANETERVIEFAEIKTEAVAATNAANAAASLANGKAQLADDKAQLADSAASLATAKAQLAQEKATYAQAQGDYAKAQGDYAKAQGDTAQADHVRAESDHTTAAADHTTAASDHTQAATDHVTATSDHTQAGSDHTRAESDHTRAESDHAAVEVYVDSLGAFDISSYHATGGVLAKYADLTAALGTNGANIPDALRKGGMSVKFVQSSDNNYVQYRLMLSEFTAAQFVDPANWQSENADEEPTAGSDNLVKSGGVVKYMNKQWIYNTGYTANPEDWEFVGNCSISANGGWNVGNTYESKSFDVTELRGMELVVTANVIGGAIISFVKSINYPKNPIFATGETGRHVIPISTFVELTVPVDANYAVVTTKNDNVDRTPWIHSVSNPDSPFNKIDITLGEIENAICGIALRTIFGKSINPTTGEFYDNSEFTLNYFNTESDTFTISFSNVQVGRTIRFFAFKDDVFLGQVHNEVIPRNAVDININFPHHRTLFVLQCHKNNVFTISNLVTEDGLSESVEKLSESVEKLSESVEKNQTYLIDTYLNKGRVVYSAHRGLRTVAPENSIPAYEEAGKVGFDFLNLAQLRQSADGTWYVMHDPTIDRTTDGTGAIKDLTDTYLQTVHIDVGSNIGQYTPDELVIPTLEKAIQIARKYGMKLYFRIASITGNSYQADKAAWDSFIAIIRKYRCEGMLFGGNALTDLLPLHRDLGLDWCINYDVYSSAAVFQQITDYVNAGIKNATIFTTSEILTDAHIAAARENGFKVMVHLTNDNTTKAQCLEWSNKGVDIIGGVVNYDLSED